MAALASSSAAQATLAELGLVDLPLLAIAKGPERNAGQERFFLTGREPLALDPRDPVLYFLQRLRDEAHRFAIQTHRGKRAREIGRSVLDQVPGIGAKRKRALLNAFRFSPGRRRGGRAGYRAGAGIDRAVAKAVYDYFQRRRLTRAEHGPQYPDRWRIVCVPIVVAMFYIVGDWPRWITCAVFTVAATTDYVDGYLARNWQQQSLFGRWLDPVADKLLVAAAVVMLVGFDRAPVLPSPIIVLREITVSGPARIHGRGQRRAARVSRLAKWKTAVQMTAIGFLLVGSAGPAWLPVEAIGWWGLWIAAILTLVTGWDYLQAGLRHMLQDQPRPSGGNVAERA